MPDEPAAETTAVDSPRRSALRRWTRRALHLVVIALAVGATVILLSAFAARRLPDLHDWHRDAPEGEFKAADARVGFGLEEYLGLEGRLWEKLDRFRIDPADAKGLVPHNRYIRGGPGDPTTFDHDWNRTTEKIPDEVRGGVLLLHGCSDSPYSFRSIVEILHRRGYATLCLRLPGHGTVPAALRDTVAEDWLAAARLGARHVAETVGPDRPFLVAGFSLGGTLALSVALDGIEDESVRTPDGLLLFSPSVGVSAFARFAMADQVLGFIPYFEKSYWLSVGPECDPFKYTSFAERAGYENWRLTRQVRDRWDALVEADRVGGFPPVLAFQSAVDATVLNSALQSFFEALPRNGSELVVFDVHHAPGLDGLLRGDHGLLPRTIDGPETGHGITVVTNAADSSPRVVARRRPAGTRAIAEIPLDLAWPRGLYSLSHIAIPFPPDDPIYGRAESPVVDGRLVLGSLVPRGEKGVLAISTETLMRIRYNPFFDYLRTRLEEFVEAR